jgi:hypothetical protein
VQMPAQPLLAAAAFVDEMRRHNAGKSALGDIANVGQPPPPESAPLTGRHHT